MEQLKSGPNEPLMMSGPKFGEENSWWSRFRKNRSNIILTIIGILIIAGGIYLYSSYQNSNQAISPEQISQQQQQEQGAIKAEDVNLGNQQNQPAPENQASSKEKAEITKEESGKITVKAQKGAGITHLARIAAKDYLEKNPDLKQNITPEHKIFIEDYITKKTGSYRLKIGQELSFDEGLINDAIQQSMKLNQKQLQNLHKYVLLVPSLSS